MTTAIRERVVTGRRAASASMKALVYHGPGRRAFQDRPRPLLQDKTDAIVRVSTTTICGTDLHILKGDVPTVAEGRVLGHEAVGYVEETGSAVTGFEAGDKVLVSCISSCGRCDQCKKGMYSHCRSGGWQLGHTLDGTQAEYVRIPHADGSLHHLPQDADEEACMLLSDIFPTGFECGVERGRVRPGDTVAIVGAGPIGLAALVTAQLYAPSALVMIDPDLNRLATSRLLGATETIKAADPNGAAEAVHALTNGEGVDVAIEAVGVPASFDTCQAIVAPGGRIANVGVHGKPVELRLERLWSHNVTITTRLVDTVSTPMLLKLVLSGRLQTKSLVTHRFALSEIMHAYDVFENAGREKALKVAIHDR